MNKKRQPAVNKDKLEALYEKYNRREFVHPDPLEFLYKYDTPLDREIVGMLASSLAFGNVRQILKSVSAVIERMKPSPAEFLRREGEKELQETFRGFKHRWTCGDEIAALLLGIGRIIELYGSLQDCFITGVGSADKNVLGALASFANDVNAAAGWKCASLLPVPERGSACKRLNLFLRWMVRRDDVDPGGWNCVSPSMLIVPLDTHMHRLCAALGFTRRRQADMKTALEVTAAFRKFSPADPVKYDFALTRLGIRSDGETASFLGDCRL